MEIRENGLRKHAGFLEIIFSLAFLMASFSSVTFFPLNVTSSEKPSLTILPCPKPSLPQSFSITESCSFPLVFNNCNHVLKIVFNFYKNAGGLVTQSCPTLATPWTVACQAPLSMGFSSKNTGVGCHIPSPGIYISQPRGYSQLYKNSWFTVFQAYSKMIMCTHTDILLQILFHFIHQYKILHTVPCVYIAGHVLLCFGFWIKASPPGFEKPALPPHSYATFGNCVVSESQFPPLSARDFVRVR